MESFFSTCSKQKALVLLGCLKILMLLHVDMPMRHFYAGFLWIHFRDMDSAG